jgi:hypothetical protein
MTITVHIDRLILDGVSIAPQEREVLQAAVEAELGRLLARGGVSPMLQATGALPRVAGGAMTWSATHTPAQRGRQIAQAVYQGLGR